jgi:short-subunit dehydrogenase
MPARGIDKTRNKRRPFGDVRIWLTGASAGIGRALAIELGRQGASIGLTARNTVALEEVASEVVEAGGKAVVLTGDVTDQEQMQALADRMEHAFGAIDILIANAGTHLFTQPDEFDIKEYMHLMSLNYGGVLNCIAAVLPGMQTAGQGHIVGMASLAGYRGIPRAAAYGASKSAVIHFLESLRFHLAGDGIPVTIINPGFVRTPLTDKNDFHMPFLIDADKAARIICRGIAKNRQEISFPIPFNWVIKLMRIIPMPLYNLIMRAIWKRMNVN